MRINIWLKVQLSDLNQRLSVLTYFWIISKSCNWERVLAKLPTHYLLTTPDEVIAIIFRQESEFSDSSAKGVNWLDTQRHLLIDYSKLDGHTIPLTGTLIKY